MRIATAAILTMTLIGCTDITAPEPEPQAVRFGGFDAPLVSASIPGCDERPCYSDVYDHVADGSGRCLVRRVTHLSDWYPISPAILTVYEIERAPANPQTGDTWRGTGKVSTLHLTNVQTDKLFSPAGITVSASNVFRVDVVVRHRRTGAGAIAFDYLRCTL